MKPVSRLRWEGSTSVRATPLAGRSLDQKGLWEAMTAPLSHADLMNALDGLARAALPRWGLGPEARLTLLNHSENTTYRIDDPGLKEPLILRVHREGYHTVNGIRSELAWMEDLRARGGVITPRPIPGLDSDPIQQILWPALPRPRCCVMFEFIAGTEPSEEDLIGPFIRLGEVSGRLHVHSRGWQRPPWFERLRWAFEETIGSQPHWGPWTDGPGLDGQGQALLGGLAKVLEDRLRRFGQRPERFGLIHADLRLANLLIQDGETRVIDFDDCGLGWFLYDAATALSFIEDRPDVPDLVAAWVEGYRHTAPLTAKEEAEIPTFIMLRRMTILAWIGSHHETELAKSQGLEYTRNTLHLAENYLAQHG